MGYHQTYRKGYVKKIYSTIVYIIFEKEISFPYTIK